MQVNTNALHEPTSPVLLSEEQALQLRRQLIAIMDYTSRHSTSHLMHKPFKFIRVQGFHHDKWLIQKLQQLF